MGPNGAKNMTRMVSIEKFFSNVEETGPAETVSIGSVADNDEISKWALFGQGREEDYILAWS